MRISAEVKVVFVVVAIFFLRVAVISIENVPNQVTNTGMLLGGKIGSGSTLEIVHDGHYRLELSPFGENALGQVAVIDGKEVRISSSTTVENVKLVSNMSADPMRYRVYTLDNAMGLQTILTRGASDMAAARITAALNVLLVFAICMLLVVLFFVKKPIG